MNRMRGFYFKARWWLGSQRSALLFSVLRRNLAYLLVTRKTDIVIEGYPRSGNTFAEAAFLLAQAGQPISIATHLHLPIQIFRAVKLNKPCLILIRQPVDAIASLLVYHNGNYPIRQAIREYVDFYELVQNFRDQLVVATFEEVLGDFGRVIRQLNDRYGCAFNEFDHTAENKEKCFKLIEKRARDKYGESDTQSLRAAKPTRERDQLKKSMANRLADAAYANDMENALSLYRAICNAGQEQFASHGPARGIEGA